MFNEQPHNARTGIWKPLLVAVGVALFAYFFLVPVIVWDPPSAAVGLPSSWPANQDLTFTVQLSAWHANFGVTGVRFYVDYHGSTSKGPEGLFYPAMVLQQQPPKLGGLLRTNRFTFPRSRQFQVTVPFREFAEQGLLGPGTLTGKVDVSCVSYEPALDRRYGGDHVESRTTSVPFTITIE